MRKRKQHDWGSTQDPLAAMLYYRYEDFIKIPNVPLNFLFHLAQRIKDDLGEY